MQWLLGLAAWIGCSLLVWAILYGGSKNDPDYYEEGYNDGTKTKESEFHDPHKSV